jgi:hypothetical protein
MLAECGLVQLTPTCWLTAQDSTWKLYLSIEGRHVLARGGASSRKSYKGEIPPYTVASLIELQYSLINRIDSMAQQVPLDEPWKCVNAAEWDAHSVSSYFTPKLWTTGAMEIMEIVCWAILGAEAHQVSLLFFLWVVRSCEGIKMLTDATGES